MPDKTIISTKTKHNSFGKTHLFIDINYLSKEYADRLNHEKENIEQKKQEEKNREKQFQKNMKNNI